MSKQSKKHGKASKKPAGTASEARMDGQAATSENVYDSLAQNAWFPALYADEELLMDEEALFPEV